MTVSTSPAARLTSAHDPGEGRPCVPWASASRLGGSGSGTSWRASSMLPICARSTRRRRPRPALLRRERRDCFCRPWQPALQSRTLRVDNQIGARAVARRGLGGRNARWVRTWRFCADLCATVKTLAATVAAAALLVACTSNVPSGQAVDAGKASTAAASATSRTTVDTSPEGLHPPAAGTAYVLINPAFACQDFRYALLALRPGGDPAAVQYWTAHGVSEVTGGGAVTVTKASDWYRSLPATQPTVKSLSASVRLCSARLGGVF